MARVSPYRPTNRQSDYALLAFPEKLWWIVNNPKHEEIQWNAQGTGIVIPHIQRFISEILNNPSSALFKTKHFASFVRQLNMYGFRKVTEYTRRSPSPPLLLISKCEFKHPYFRKGRRDLLVHVKRQIYSSRKPTEHRQQKSRTPPPTENQLVQPSAGSTSVSATWNPTLYTPMPFVPWQTSLQMPFTWYAPFCNPYQMAQMQQGPVAGVPNFQGLGLAGQLKQSSASPSLTWSQSLGSYEGNVKSVSSPTSMQQETWSAGVVSSQQTLPVEAVEGLNSLRSPPKLTSTVTAVPFSNSTSNVVLINNASHPTSDVLTESNARHNGFMTRHSSAVFDTNFSLSAQNNTPKSFQERTHSLSRESVEPSVSRSQSFTVHALLKESAVKPSVSGSQYFMPKENGGSFVTHGDVRNTHRLCKALTSVHFAKDSTNV